MSERWKPLCFGLGLVLLAGPAHAEAPPPGTLVALEGATYRALRTWNDRFAQELRTDLEARQPALTFKPLTAFEQRIHAYLTDQVPSIGLQYTSLDAHQQPRIYSGRLFLPRHKPGSQPTLVPLVIYQHGTETQRQKVPFHYRGAETALGALGAQAAGFAVAMPDGDGMGADPSPERHAYCQEATTARCLLDLARAIQGAKARIFDGINYAWDGRLFIMGYSEGGYIALAAVKALSTDPAWRDLRLDGAACMGGPFDLGRMVRTLTMDTPETYARPYIPAYLLSTWPALYPGAFRFEDAIHPRLLDSEPSRPGGPDRGSILQWLDGSLEGDEITKRIQARLTGNPRQPVPARGVLNGTWARAELDLPHSRVNQLLDDNSLIQGWTPKVPVLLAHDPQDECVPYANSRDLFDVWQRRGLHPYPIVELEAAGRGSGHVGGALLSVPMAFLWFRAGMPRSVAGMAVATLKNQVVDGLPTELAGVVDRAALVATREQNVNRAEFPLSRLHPSADRGRPWTVALTDRFWSVGKVKLYTLTPFPQYMGQQPVPGHTSYTKFIKALRKPGDRCALPPDEDTFLAVYPQNGTVALTLGFEGPGPGGRLNIKQVKNKVLAASAPAFAGDAAFLRTRVHPTGFEHPDDRVPFVTLP